MHVSLMCVYLHFKSMSFQLLGLHFHRGWSLIFTVKFTVSLWIVVVLNVCFLKTICSIYLKLTVINTNTYRYLHINFLSDLTNLRLLNFNFKLTK